MKLQPLSLILIHSACEFLAFRCAFFVEGKANKDFFGLKDVCGENILKTSTHKASINWLEL